MTMTDVDKTDHKIIAIATGDPEFNSYVDASQLPPHRLLVVRRFFPDYKQLEGLYSSLKLPRTAEGNNSER